MVTFVPSRPARRLWAAALLTAGVLAMPLAPRAHAAFAACRADPIVALSNGVKVQMGNTIYDAAANVTKVAYTLHGPAGTTVKSVVYPTDNTSGVPETFAYVADNQAGDYDSYSSIYDANTGVNVTAATVVTNTITGQSVNQTAQTHLSGWGVALHIHAHLN